ncbi:FAD-dependent oxidoreductase [Anaerolineales bacterium]
MQVNEKIIIIGAGYAGLMSALMLGKKARKMGLKVSLINPSPDFQEKIRLHQVLTGQGVKGHPIEALLKGSGVEFIQGKVLDIQKDADAVVVERQGGQREVLGYDRLILAMGSIPKMEGVKGLAEYAQPLDARSVEMLKTRLPGMNREKASCAIIGAGLTGIETVTEIREVYPEIRLKFISASPVGSHLSQKGQAYLRQKLSQLKIEVFESAAIEITEKQIHLANGQVLDYDLCLWTGANVAHPLIAESHLPHAANGQALVDAYLKVQKWPNIYAIGDNAQVYVQPQASLRMACATAMPMGTYVGRSILKEVQGKAVEPFRFGYVFRCISLGRRDGLIQFVDAEDQPVERVWVRWLGRITKELISSSTVWMLKLSRIFPNAYFYPKGKARIAYDEEIRAKHGSQQGPQEGVKSLERL